MRLVDKIMLTKDYRKALKQLENLKNLVSTIYSIKEIKMLTDMSSKYKDLFKKVRNGEVSQQIINSLLDHLLVSSAYYERLMAIKTDLIHIKSNAKYLSNSTRRLFSISKAIMDMKKQDRDAVTNYILFPFLSLLEQIDDYVSVIDNSITYIDKAQFNIKAVVSSLKNNERKYY